MKKLNKLTITALLLFFCLTFKSYAQYGNVWTFGYHYGLDFNSGAPVFFDTTAIFCLKGSASVCDSSGQLLFYTDGTHVWNKLNQQMPNGDSMAYISTDVLGLGIPTNANQPAVIVPIENTSLYYIFTTDALHDGLVPGQLKYHIVDLAAENGLGDVTVKNQVLISQDVSEKLVVTRHCNGHDWWIVTRIYTTDEYVSYLLTDTGTISPPVITHTGLFGPAQWVHLGLGQSKISPNGKFILNTYPHYGVELGTFDNETGNIQIILQDFDIGQKNCHGGSFSADSKYFYDDVLFYDTLLIDTLGYQGDYFIDRYFIGNPDSAAIMQSKFTMFQRDSIAFFENFQLAPDGNIYLRGSILDTTELPQWTRDKLFVIKQGNDSVIETSIYFAHPNLLSSWGLPSFPDAIFTNHHKASLRIPTCLASVFDSIPFYDSLLTTTRDYIWDFGDPASGINNTFNGQFPIHSFSSPGVYTVTLTLPSDCNPITITQQVIANPTSANTPTITFNNIYLESSIAFQYQWFLNNNLIVGATNQTFIPISNGDYTVTITDSNNCSQTSAIFNLTNVSILTNNNPYNFSFNPNPAWDQIVINNPNLRQTKITISDLIGNLIIQTNLNKTQENIDISQLSNGIYLINIDNHFNQKLVVNK